MKGFIHDFNSQPEQQIMLPEAGRLSVGEKVKNAKGVEYPQSLDYFRVYNADKTALAAFRAVYGDKPSELEVSFLSSNPLEVCRTQYTLRCGSRKYAWGDGQTFNYWHVKNWSNPLKHGEMATIVVESEEERDLLMEKLEQEAEKTAKVQKIKASQWTMELTLQVWLPKVPVPGVWIFRTGGAATSIKRISGVFRTVYMAAKTVQMLPFKLRVKKVTGDTMETKNYPIVTLIPPSAPAMEAVREHGKKLFEYMFGNEGMRVMDEQTILKASEKLKLKSGGGGEYNAAPVVVETSEPNPLTQNMADSYFKNADEEEGKMEISLTKGHEPKEGSLLHELERVRLASTWIGLMEVWKENEAHQSAKAFRKKYAIRAVELCHNRETLDDLVRSWKELYNDKEFKQAVIDKRKQKGWKNGK